MKKLLRIIKKLFSKKRESKEVKFYVREIGTEEWREMKCEDPLIIREPFKPETTNN